MLNEMFYNVSSRMRRERPNDSWGKRTEMVKQNEHKIQYCIDSKKEQLIMSLDSNEIRTYDMYHLPETFRVIYCYQGNYKTTKPNQAQVKFDLKWS